MRCLIWLNQSRWLHCAAWNSPSLSLSIPQAVQCTTVFRSHSFKISDFYNTDLRSAFQLNRAANRHHYAWPRLIQGQICQSVAGLNSNQGLLSEISAHRISTLIKTFRKLSRILSRNKNETICRTLWGLELLFSYSVFMILIVTLCHKYGLAGEFREEILLIHMNF